MQSRHEKQVAGVRKILSSHIPQCIRPLISPLRPNYQCLGVYDLKMMRLYNYIYQNLGIHYSIVHTLDGYDEISLTDTCKVTNNRGEYIYEPEDLSIRLPTRNSGAEKRRPMQPGYL